MVYHTYITTNNGIHTSDINIQILYSIISYSLFQEIMCRPIGNLVNLSRHHETNEFLYQYFDLPLADFRIKSDYKPGDIVISISFNFSMQQGFHSIDLQPELIEHWLINGYMKICFMYYYEPEVTGIIHLASCERCSRGGHFVLDVPSHWTRVMQTVILCEHCFQTSYNELDFPDDTKIRFLTVNDIIMSFVRRFE